MKPFVVIADGMHSDIFSRFVKSDQFRVHPQSTLTSGELEQLLPKLEGLVVRSKTHVNGDLLQKAPLLKYVVRAGEGTDNIDKISCREQNVVVANTPGANNNSAAEHAIALMMTLLRQTARADARMKKGGWNKSDYQGQELWKKRVGIVGLGRVGRLLAQRLSGFEMDMGFYDPFVKENVPVGMKPFERLEDIFSQSDIITLHVPLMDKTRGLVGQRLLSCMPSHAVLINASRGGVVDEEALCRHLKEKKMAGGRFGRL